MWEDKKKIVRNIKEIGLSKIGILLLAGVLLFLVSNLISGSGSEKKKEGGTAGTAANTTAAAQRTESDETFAYIARQEQRLKEILEHVEGIGKVEVMISVTSSREKVTLSDTPYTQKMTEESDSAGGTRKTTEVEREDATIYETEGNSQSPYVVKELEPEMSGVLILAEGAGSDTVKAEIAEAVEALFGLPAHRIKVIKRRG